MLARRRRENSTRRRGCWVSPPITLGLPDGQLAEHETTAAVLTDILGTGPPVPGVRPPGVAMGTPITEAVGRAAARAAAAVHVPLLEYPDLDVALGTANDPGADGTRHSRSTWRHRSRPAEERKRH